MPTVSEQVESGLQNLKKLWGVAEMLSNDVDVVDVVDGEIVFKPGLKEAVDAYNSSAKLLADLVYPYQCNSRDKLSLVIDGVTLHPWHGVILPIAAHPDAIISYCSNFDFFEPYPRYTVEEIMSPNFPGWPEQENFTPRNFRNLVKFPPDFPNGGSNQHISFVRSLLPFIGVKEGADFDSMEFLAFNANYLCVDLKKQGGQWVRLSISLNSHSLRLYSNPEKGVNPLEEFQKPSYFIGRFLEEKGIEESLLPEFEASAHEVAIWSQEYEKIRNATTSS